MNILAVGAHPADVFDLAGGTLANFAAEGHSVFLAILTHGAYSHTQLVSDRSAAEVLAECRALKRKECDQAAGHIGAREVRYFDYDDEPVMPTREMILALGEFIREIHADILITHHPREYGHPDHPVVGDVSLRAAKAAERWLEGSTQAAHLIKRIYFYGTQFRAICAQLGSYPVPADFVVDISASIEKKKHAIAAFQSQSFKGARYDEEWASRRVDRIEGYWGIMTGVAYAEEFTSLTPQTVRLLP